MEAIEAIIGGLATGGGSFLGGVLALAGNWMTHKQQMAMKHLDMQARSQELDQEIRLTEIEIQRSTVESEAAIELADTHGSWQGLAESYKAAASVGDSYKWVQAVRTLVRPVLTLGSLGFVAGAAFGFAGPDLQSDAMMAIQMTAQTSATWWFGDRALHRAKS